MDVMAPQYCSQSTQTVCSMPAILDRSSGKLEEALSTVFRPCSSEPVCDFLYSVGVQNKKRGIQRFNKDGCHTKRFSLTPFTLCVPGSGLCWTLRDLNPRISRPAETVCQLDQLDKLADRAAAP